MKKKYILIGVVMCLLLFVGCINSEVDNKTILETSEKSLDEWKTVLSDEEFHVLWEKGTERPFSGDLLDNKKNGTYVTAGCGIPVFSSEQKFDSGTGWPSFYDTPYRDNLIFEEDYSLGVKRIEIMSSCGEHLGHVFNDGPEPTGLRYCINSAALNFIES